MTTELLPGETVLTSDEDRDPICRVVASVADQGRLSLAQQSKTPDGSWELDSRVLLMTPEIHALARLLNDLGYGGA